MIEGPRYYEKHNVPTVGATIGRPPRLVIPHLSRPSPVWWTGHSGPLRGGGCVSPCDGAISWYNVSITENPKATGGLYHSSPRVENPTFPREIPTSHGFLGMTYFFTLTIYRYRSETATWAAGARHPPYEYAVTAYHSTGGLPRQCAHWLAMTGKLSTIHFRKVLPQVLAGIASLCAGDRFGGAGGYDLAAAVAALGA